MKIFSDINEIIPLRLKNNYISHRQNSGTSNSVNFSKRINIEHSFMQKMNMERTFGDALSIAQMSQNIIQKAMMISSRLSSIASQAFTTGKVNIEELNRSITEIDSSIKEFGEKVIAPVQMSNKSEAGHDYKRIGGVLISLKSVAGNIKTDGKNNNDELNNVVKALNRDFGEVSSRTLKVKESMNSLMNQYPGGSIKELMDKSDSVINLIETRPDTTMRSQGNISHSKAVFLTR